MTVPVKCSTKSCSTPYFEVEILDESIPIAYFNITQDEIKKGFKDNDFIIVQCPLGHYNKFKDGEIVQDFAVSEIDKYWIEKGKGYLDESLAKLTKTIENIKLYLDGLSLVSFTGGLTINSIFETTDPEVIYVLLAFPVFLQIAKYFLAVELIEPVVTKIDARSPIQIKKAYNLFFDKLNKRVKQAKTISFLATLLGAALVMIGISRHNQNIDLEKKISLLTSVQKASCVIDYSESFIKVKGTFPRTDDITINLEGTITRKKVKKDTIILFSGILDSEKSIDEKYLLCDIEYFKAKRVLVIYKDLDQENAFIKTIN
jgi:hypothetical protein